ncbi:MAG: hypothetical protein HYT79_09290 [Elusimicrobia bacterium]|nr:hypothetical protein [Elusimicrobiota bacterium]
MTQKIKGLLAAAGFFVLGETKILAADNRDWQNWSIVSAVHDRAALPRFVQATAAAAPASVTVSLPESPAPARVSIMNLTESLTQRLSAVDQEMTQLNQREITLLGAVNYRMNRLCRGCGCVEGPQFTNLAALLEYHKASGGAKGLLKEIESWHWKPAMTVATVIAEANVIVGRRNELHAEKENIRTMLNQLVEPMKQQ